MEVGAHCVQINLQKGIGVNACHELVVSIVNQHEHIVSNEELISTLGENRGVRGWLQKKAAEMSTKLQSDEGMLHSFLDLPSKLENIILFFPRTNQNSSYYDVAALEERLKWNRLTRNMGVTSHAQIIKQSRFKSRTTRSSRMSRKIKHANKNCQ